MPLQKSIFVISSTVLNQFIQKLDARLDQQRKPSVNANIKRERVEGVVSNSSPPFSLPKWMINPAHQHLLSVDEIASGSAVSQVSVQADGIIGGPGEHPNTCRHVSCDAQLSELYKAVWSVDSVQLSQSFATFTDEANL